MVVSESCGMHTSPIPASLADRTAKLNGLFDRLRTNHFGIDTEIQRLLDAFAPWYRFAETQSRPQVIGLWGMTGTGKSSLIRSMVKAAELEDRTYWLDAGECQKEYWLGSFIERIEKLQTGTPFVLVVDEFQRARTKENGIDIEEATALRELWELLDSGRIITWPHFHHASNVIDFEGRFSRAMRAGVRIHSGRVVEGHEKFKELVQTHYSRSQNATWGIPDDIWDSFRGMHLEPQPSVAEIEDRLSTMNEKEILSWTEELLRNSQRARVVDASKMLVILSGNLDELYTAEKEALAELDPDVLLHRHRDIGLAGVQNALTELFRIEQVGRLGASHVVFPPIGKATVDKLVQHAVNELTGKLSAHCERTITVDAALVDHLRSTSAIAVLGARPVVQAVQNTVPLLLSQTMDLPNAEAATSIAFGITDGRYVARLTVEGEEHEAVLPLPVARHDPHDMGENQIERTAVHEVGHLLCGVLLCGKKPLQVCARTRDPQVVGFVAWDRRPKMPHLRSEIVPELASLLGGWVAERIHFGADGVSTGSTRDIQLATDFALNMVKNHGMGGMPLHFAEYPSTDASGGIRTAQAAVDTQAREWMEAAEAMAIATLEGQQELFDRCVERLRAKGSLNMRELEELLNPAEEPQYIGTLNLTEA